MPPALRLDGFIKHIENDIADERRDDATLGTPLCGDADDVILTDTRLEESLQKRIYSSVGDFVGDEGKGYLVVQTVKERGDIGVYNAFIAFLRIPYGGSDGVVCFAARSETVTSLRKSRVENR